MIPYLILILAIPLGLFFAKLTHDEEHIYQKYFPSLIWGAAFCATVFLTTNRPVGLALSFMVIMMFSWNNPKMFHIKKKRHHKTPEQKLLK